MIGLTAADAPSDMPTSNSSPPRPMSPSLPESSIPAAIAMRARPTQPRFVAAFSYTSPSCGRIASSGVMREAAIAGSIAESTVAPMPSVIASTQVLTLNEVSNDSMRIRSPTSSLMPAAVTVAKPQPASSPRPVPSTPCTRLSVRNRPRIWRRDAPMARSMPMSCRRSATMVRNVFRMMNPPMASAKRPSTLKMVPATSKPAASVESAVTLPMT